MVIGNSGDDLIGNPINRLTLFLPALGGISPYMSVTWPSPVGIGLSHVHCFRIFFDHLHNTVVKNMGSFNVTIAPEDGNLNLPVLVDYTTEDVVNLNKKVLVTALASKGDVERSNVLQNTVVRGINKDPKKYMK